MRFGYNVLSKDATLRPHMEKINPGGMIYFQDQIDEAKWAKARFPNAHIMIRFWPDSDTYKKFPDPQKWVDAHSDMIGTGLIVQTMNEGGFTPEIIAWHVRLLNYLLNTGTDLRVGVLGLNVGTPKPEEWGMADEMFRLMAKMRGRVYLVLHEYFGAVVTSGIIGGDPNNAGVAHGQPGGYNLVPIANWPSNPQAQTLWHVGRYMFLKRHLASVGIPMPQIIIGEFGADYLSDIDAYLRTLHSTQGQYDIVDGWRDLWNDWRTWYNLEPGDVYMKMAEYADKFIYGSDVVAILFFARGTNGGWKTYRTDPDLDPYIEKYVAGNTPPVVPPVVVPPVVTPPAPTPIDRSAILKALIQQTLDNFK